MPGGLMNLVAYGNQNVILNGNPKKTFFTTTYSKYTNFGLQKFRIDFDGQRKLRMTDQSIFEFKVPRYGDLLMDTYLVVDLPNIWSPAVPPVCGSNPAAATYGWQPYEFKWIKNLGTQMIELVRFKIGGQIIQEFTGQYLYNLVERDFNDAKKDLYYKMTGHVTELNDPANANGRVNIYPTAFVGTGSDYDTAGNEPSIRGRQIYVPLNIWFTLASKMALPLVSLQYVDVTIEVTIRPVNQLFTVRNISDITSAADPNAGYYRSPNFADPTYEFYKFLHQPPGVDINNIEWPSKRTDWNADVHLISTYAFLSDAEVEKFAREEQRFLIKEVYTRTYHDIVGSKRQDIFTQGLVSNWMWFMQRSDSNLRNQWSNYTNWPYDYLPYNVDMPDGGTTKPIVCGGQDYFPNEDLGRQPSGLFWSGIYNPANQKEIMTSWGLLVDGKYRENVLPSGVLNYIEKYAHSNGNSPEGLYCYNFGLHTDPYDFQPNGAMNMSKFTNVTFEIETMHPVHNEDAKVQTICNNDGDVIGVVKPSWGIYEYTYNMTVMEERYNVLVLTNGMGGLEFAR
uniref:Major capsid protein N-terminal domain-containing protein n=1 Tax=viral metagenome TaxID=1070528 RepID=A0A6C0CSM6_9ZZZZ